MSHILYVKTGDRQTVKVVTQCPFCKKKHLVTCKPQGFSQWKNGELIQQALPNLTADERELLITGLCQACFPDKGPVA